MAYANSGSFGTEVNRYLMSVVEIGLYKIYLAFRNHLNSMHCFLKCLIL